MKFLDTPNLASVAASLCIRNNGTQLGCQLEAYSCKQAGVDKKVFKQWNFQEGHTPNELQVLSPPTTMMGFPSSPVNNEMASRKTLFYLMATLNAAFPDYDFTKATSMQFSREPSLEVVAHSVNTTFQEAAGEAFASIRHGLWQAIDSEICVNDCEVYCYLPGSDTDPFNEPGTVWSFNYFFYNPKLKRVLFFMGKATSLLAAGDTEEDEIMGDDDSSRDE
eukprot:Ihof_evm1s309 gene=Ihof_evmTU1s309